MIERSVVEEALLTALNEEAGLIDPQLDDPQLLETVDSLTWVAIVMALENVFDVDTPDDEIDAWKLEDLISFFVQHGRPC